jgi:hypothetical protein
LSASQTLLPAAFKLLCSCCFLCATLPKLAEAFSSFSATPTEPDSSLPLIRDSLLLLLLLLLPLLRTAAASSSTGATEDIIIIIIKTQLLFLLLLLLFLLLLRCGVSFGKKKKKKKQNTQLLPKTFLQLKPSSIPAAAAATTG